MSRRMEYFSEKALDAKAHLLIAISLDVHIEGDPTQGLETKDGLAQISSCEIITLLLMRPNGEIVQWGENAAR